MEASIIVGILSAIGGSCGTAVAIFFLKDFFNSTKTDIHDLTTAVNDLTKEVTRLMLELRGIQRDLSKMEGIIEHQQSQLTQSIKETSGLLANIKALWSALERIHPVALPGRISDTDA